MSEQQATAQAQEPESPEITYATEAEALAGRAAGLAAYNNGDIDEAIAIQTAVLRFFTAAHGEVSPRIGLYYLDYGLSLLADLQTQAGDQAGGALSEFNEEDGETCNMVLQVALECFEKAEEEVAEGDEAALATVALRQADCYSALGQLYLEADESEEALKRFETALLHLRGIEGASAALPEVRKATAMVLVNICGCYSCEGDFEGSVEKYQEAVAFVEALPDGLVDAALLAELRESLADAIDARDNKTYDAAKAAIDELMPAAANEPVMPDAAPANALMSAIPGGLDGGANSQMILGSSLACRENSNSASASRSVFPKQGTDEQSRSFVPRSASNSNAAPNTVKVVKKPKQPTPAAPAAADSGAAPSVGEPETKKLRSE